MLLKIKPKLSAWPLGSTAESDLGSRCSTTRTRRPVLRHFQAPAKADRVCVGFFFFFFDFHFDFFFFFFAVTLASFQWHCGKSAASSVRAPLPLRPQLQPARSHHPAQAPCSKHHARVPQVLPPHPTPPVSPWLSVHPDQNVPPPSWPAYIHPTLSIYSSHLKCGIATHTQIHTQIRVPSSHQGHDIPSNISPF